MATIDLSGGGGGHSTPYTPPAPNGPGYQPPAGGGGGGGGNWQGALGQQLVQNAMNDPNTQAQMKAAGQDMAARGYVVAKEGAAQAYEELHKYIQEGPAGVSILCFLGGMATTIVGIFGILSIFSIILTPFHYILNAYLTLFGIVTVLLEADSDRLHNIKVMSRLAPWVQEYQHRVFDNAKFLTELRGRGFFYLFVGTLAISQCIFCLLFLCGAWNLLMGILCLMMSFGVNPSSIHPNGESAAMVDHEQGYNAGYPPPHVDPGYGHINLSH